MTPRFDDLVNDDLSPAERERLERAHNLLVAAGPPAELSPELERGPTLAMTLSRRRGGPKRRLMLLAAAVAVLALVFFGGYAVGNHGGSLTGSHTLELAGTKAAPGALASLVITNPDSAGNWPMHLSVTGLPRLPKDGYYEVYLTRHGKPFALCGVFLVQSRGGAVSVQLNAPYQIRKGDSWVVTRQLAGGRGAGTVVLHPLT